MSKNSRLLSKTVREAGKGIGSLVGPRNARFLMSVYGNPNRARHADESQNNLAYRILEQYELI